MKQHAERVPRRHFNYSNVMSTLAVFLVVAGGTALAAALPKSSVKSKTVKDNSLKSKDLKDGRAVGGADVIADQVQLRVGESCPAGQAIRLINVQGGVICEVDDQGAGGGPPSGPAGGDLTGTYPNPAIANNAVNSAKVADESLTGGDVANASLTGGDVVDNALGGDDIAESTLGQVPSALLGGFGRSGGTTGCDPESATFVSCAGTEIISVPPGARALAFGRTRGAVDVGDSFGVGGCRLSTSSIGTVANTQQQLFDSDVDGGSENGTLVGVTPPLPAGATSFGIECNEDAGGIRYLDISASAVLISGS